MAGRRRLIKQRKKPLPFVKSDSQRLLDLAEEIKRLMEEFSQPDADRPKILSHR